MLRSVLISRDERQIDVGLRCARQFNFGLLSSVLEALQRQPILTKIDAVFFAKLVGKVVDDALVEIFTAKERIAVGRLDLKHAIPDLKHRDVEGAATKVVD